MIEIFSMKNMLKIPFASKAAFEERIHCVSLANIERNVEKNIKNPYIV